MRQAQTTVLFAPRTRESQLVSLMKEKEVELRGVSKMTIMIVECRLDFVQNRFFD